VDRVDGLLATYPFLERATIARGSYAASAPFPNEDIPTISTRELLVARSTVSDRVAFQIVESLFNSASQLVNVFPLLTQLSRTEPQQAFYYSLHPGAVSFYRRTGTSLFSWQLMTGAVTWSVSATTAVLTVLRRRRVRVVLDELDAVRARLNTEPDLETAFDRHDGEFRRVQDAALRLRRKWRITEDQYNCIREHVRVSREDLGRRCGVAVDQQASRQSFDTIPEARIPRTGRGGA
jgi:hypothetical protein